MTSPRRLRACSLRNRELRRQTPYILVPLLCASRAPLHNSISTEGSHYARSEATTSSSSPALDTFPIDEGATEQQQEVGQEKGECNSGDEDEGPQQEVNGVAPVMAERVADAHLSGKEDGSPRSAERHLLARPSNVFDQKQLRVNHTNQSFCFIVSYRFPQNFIANKCSQVLASSMYLPPFPNSQSP